MAQMYTSEVMRLRTRLGDQAPPDHVIRMFLTENNGNEERTFQALTHQGWNEPRLPDTIESANLLSSQPPTHYPAAAGRPSRSSWQYEQPQDTLRAEPPRHHPVAMGSPGYPIASPRRSKSTSPFSSPSDTTLTSRAEIIAAQRNQLESMKSVDFSRKIVNSCAPSISPSSPVLAFMKYVIFPILSGKEFVISREEKFGGTVSFTEYSKLEEVYAKEEVYPLDLKNAVALELNNLLEPIRVKFTADPALQRLRDLAYPGGEKTASVKAAAASGARPVDISRLDIRVGHIVSAEKHSDADTLYVEKIDVGDSVPRTIVSGLAKYLPLDELRDRNVIVLCNLKPMKMRGVESQGMLLAADGDGKVEPLDPPSGSKPGDKIFVEGYTVEASGAAPDELLNPKKKIFEQVQTDLSVTSDHVVTYKNLPLQTAAGPVLTATLVSATIR